MQIDKLLAGAVPQCDERLFDLPHIFYNSVGYLFDSS